MNTQQLNKVFNDCIQNENELWNNFSSFYDNIEQDAVIKALIDNVQKTIKDTKIKAVQKYYSLQLLKTCLGKKTQKLTEYIAKNLLPTLAEFSRHNKGSSDPKRGQNVFGPGQDKDASNDFFFLLLESIKAWSLMFPNIVDFKKTFNALTKEGVVFPKEMINYQLELQELNINAGASSSGFPSSNNLQTPQPQQQQQPPQPQALDSQTEEQVKKLSKFLSNIDQNLRVIDNADPQSLDLQILGDCIGPLSKQLSKISEPLILQVLQLPQYPVTEQLQKKLFEVKELLETIIKEYTRASEKPKLFPQIINSLRSQITIYLQNNADGGSQIMQQQQIAPPPQQQQQYAFNQQPQSGKKNQNFNDFDQFGQGQQQQGNSEFNNFQFNNFNAAPSNNNLQQQQFGFEANKDVFTEFGGFKQQDNPPLTQKNDFDQFGAGFNQQQQQGNLDMGYFGFNDQSTHQFTQNMGQGFGDQDLKTENNQFQGFNAGQGFDDHQSVQNQQGFGFDDHLTKKSQQGFEFDNQNFNQQNMNMGQFGFDGQHQNLQDQQQFQPSQFGFEEQKHNVFDQVFAGVGDANTDNQLRKESLYGQQNLSHDLKQGNQFDQQVQNQFHQGGFDQNNFGVSSQGDQHQQPHYDQNIDFFQSQGGNNQMQDNHDTQSQKSQKNQGYTANSNTEHGNYQDVNWGGDYNNQYGNQHSNNQLDSSKNIGRKQSQHSQNSGQGADNYYYQQPYGNENIENRNKMPSYASQVRGGYDHNEFTQPPQVSQNQDEMGANKWNDHMDQNQQNHWGNQEIQGGESNQHTNVNNHNFGDMNQSYNQGQHNQNYDYDNYGYNYNDPQQQRKSSQTDFNVANSQQINTQHSRRQSQTDFNQSQYNYNINNEQFGRRPSQTDINQLGSNSLNNEQRKDSFKDSVYNANLTESQYDMVLHRKNSAYQKYKKELEFYNNPVLTESWQQNKESVFKPIDYQATYDPNMVYDPNPTQPDHPQQYDQHNQSLQDINKANQNNSMNQGNNAPMKYDDLTGHDNMQHQRQPSQQSDKNWGMGGADTTSNQGKRKDSTHSNQYQNNNQNTGWDNNFDFFNDNPPQQKQPSNSQIPHTDFFGGDASQTHQQEQKMSETSSQQGNKNNMNTSYNQHNNDWGNNNFDKNYEYNDNHFGGNTNTNASQQKFDFNNGFDFDQQHKEPSVQTNPIANQHDFFGEDFGGPTQPIDSNKQNNHIEGFNDNFQQPHSATSQNKQWFEDMKQVNHDDIFNNIGTQQQSQLPNQNAAAINNQNQVDFFNDFGSTPTPIQPQTQTFDSQFDFGQDKQHQQQHPSGYQDHQQPQWNQPDTNYHGTLDNQNQFAQQQQQQPQKGLGGNVDLIDMFDNNNNANQQQNQSQQFQQQQLYQQQMMQQQQQQQNQQNLQQQVQQPQGGFDFFDMYGQNNNTNQIQVQQQQQNVFGLNQQPQQQQFQQQFQQQQQQRELAQPGKPSQVGQIFPPYQIGQKIVRDSQLQTTNEFDKSRVGIKTYKVLEVSPEIRKRNEEFYQQLSKEETIKSFVEDQRKELLNKKLIEADADKSSIINKKLEALNMFQLLIIEKKDYVDLQYTSTVPKSTKNSQRSLLALQPISIQDVEQKETAIREIKELNDQISKLQNEMQRRIGDEYIFSKRIDELEKELFNTKKNHEKIKKELEGILKEHEKVLISEKEIRGENERLQKVIEELNEELQKLKNDNSKILNEIIDPEFFKKSFINQSPQSAGPDMIESGVIELDPQSKKVLNNVRQKYDEYHSVKISRSMREGYKVVEDKIHSAASLEITTRVKNNLDKLLQLNYQTSPHKDDALVKMIGAKSIRQKQKEKNKIFFNTLLFREMVELPIYQNDRDNLDNFKYACLNSKAILYENPFLQIGAITNYEEKKNSTNNSLLLTLHFINKSQAPISFTFNFSTFYKMIRPGCEVQSPVTINGKSQKKHTVEAFEFDINQSIPLVDINIQNQQFNDTARIAIPMTLNKFMVFQPIDSMQFKQRWQNFKTTYVHNEPREMNERFIKNLSDIKRYFECMVELTNRQRPLRSRYGVTFRIDGISQFLLKICLVASYDSFKDVAEYLCNYFCFLFTI